MQLLLYAVALRVAYGVVGECALRGRLLAYLEEPREW
jgi:hypothetical protein